MASQQAVQSGEPQDTISVPLVEPRGEASNGHNSARPQPLLANRELISIDQILLNACMMVGGARKALDSYRVALDDATQRCSAWEQAYYEERQKYIAYAGAYAELYDKHERTFNDLHGVSTQCLSLHQDLEHAQTVILDLQLKIQEQERSSDGKDTPDTGEGCGVSQLDWGMVEQGIENEQLKARIRELENEKSKMMQEHENALADAVNQIYVDKRGTGGRVRRSRKVKREPEPEPCSP